MILTFDIGTTLIKGALFSREGELLTLDREEIPRAVIQEGVFHEVDPRSWLEGLSSLSRKLTASIEASSVSALCISGNGPTLVCTGENKEPLMPALSWLDRRGVEESRYIREKTGHFIDASFYLPKVLWIRGHKKVIFDKTRFFLGCPEYILYVLTGIPSNVVTGPLLGEYTWTEDLLDSLELPLEKFPGDRKPGEILGGLLPEPAKQWGLKPGVPVIAGGPDFVLTLLGTAAVSPGRVCDRSGSSEGINLCTPRLNLDSRLMSFEHPVEGFYNTSGSISNSGRALDWFRHKVLRSTRDFDSLFDQASAIPPGSRNLLFLPYLTGERAPLWDPRLRGAFLGLNDHHGDGEMLRAVLESVGFALRHVIEVMEFQGDTVEDLRITGNPARSDLWNQIKADITGKRFMVAEVPEAELTGGAILAFHTLGRTRSLGEGADHLIRFSRTYTPRQENRQLYAHLYGIYRDAVDKLQTVSHRLADGNP